MENAYFITIETPVKAANDTKKTQTKFVATDEELFKLIEEATDAGYKYMVHKGKLVLNTIK